MSEKRTITPEMMLKFYRENSPIIMVEQAEMFRKMPDKLRAELLFYMISHITLAMQESEGAQEISLDEAKQIIAEGRPN